MGQKTKASGTLSPLSYQSQPVPWGGGGGEGVGGCREGIRASEGEGSEAPFSWQDIKPHTKCFHVVPALGLRPSRQINPGGCPGQTCPHNSAFMFAHNLNVITQNQG